MSEKITIERIYRASLDELWKMWTTKPGFESWWAPDGFRIQVHTIEARANGKLLYDMIAEAPEVVSFLKNLVILIFAIGLPTAFRAHRFYTK